MFLSFILLPFYWKKYKKLLIANFLSKYKYSYKKKFFIKFLNIKKKSYFYTFLANKKVLKNFNHLCFFLNTKPTNASPQSPRSVHLSISNSHTPSPPDLPLQLPIYSTFIKRNPSSTEAATELPTFSSPHVRTRLQRVSSFRVDSLQNEISLQGPSSLQQSSYLMSINQLPTSSYQSWPTINEHRVRTTWTNRSRPDHHECSTDSSTWAFLSRVPSSSSAIPVATPKNSPSLIRSSTNVPAALRRSKNASTKTRIRCLPVVVCFGVLPSPC